MNADTALAKPRYNGGHAIYSCTPGNSSTQYEVHVLAMHETPGRTGHATVNIISHGKSNRSIVLVLGSYQPVNWILSLPSNVSISKVVLVSTRSHNAANWNVKQSSPLIDRMFCKINLSYRSVKSFQNILVTSRKHSLRYLGPRLWRKFPPDLTSAKALNIFKLSRIRKNDVSSMIDDGCKGCFLCSS